MFEKRRESHGVCGPNFNDLMDIRRRMVQKRIPDELR